MPLEIGKSKKISPKSKVVLPAPGKRTRKEVSASPCLHVMGPKTELMSLVDAREDIIVADVETEMAEESEKSKAVAVFQNRLNRLYAQRVEQERNRLVQKYFGRHSKSGFFNQFVEEPPAQKKINIEVKVSVTT